MKEENMEVGRYVAPLEAGLSQGEFFAKQKERQMMSDEYASQERNRPHRKYLIFSNQESKETARKLIGKFVKMMKLLNI